jgi:flagellar motility protein MotE (MotC chaperone)
MAIIGAVFLLAAASVVVADESSGKAGEEAAGADAVKAAAAAAKGSPVAAAKGTPIALTMEAIEELDQRKKALDARERQLEERAKSLEIQEKLLKEKLHRMEELNKKMADRLDTFQKDHDGKITKLVTVVETMKPQAAAEYVENLDADLAVAILAKIQVAKAAKIMNLVDKKKSARLTEMYTGYRDSIEPAGAPAAPAAKEALPANTKM